MVHGQQWRAIGTFRRSLHPRGVCYQGRVFISSTRTFVGVLMGLERSVDGLAPQLAMQCDERACHRARWGFRRMAVVEYWIDNLLAGMLVLWLNRGICWLRRTKN